MTRQEYEAKLADLQSQIEELKQAEIEEDSPKPPHPRWKPKRDEPYYTINVGCACAGSCTWDSDNIDGDIYSLGFVFKTEAETEFAIERLKVLAEMREWSGKPNDHYRLALDYNMSELIANRTDCPYLINSDMRFATKEDAENCINAVGADRIKKYYFMIPEEKK